MKGLNRSLIWFLFLQLGGLWSSLVNSDEDTDHIFNSDPILLAVSEQASASNSWLTCFDRECNSAKRQKYENVYTHKRRVFHIYANDRSADNDPISYGDEVALFYKENDEGFGRWLSCESDGEKCGLGTCPGLPHFKHWMWNSESCSENKFIIASGDSNVYDERQPLKIGDEIHLVKTSNKERHFNGTSSFERRPDSLSHGDGFVEILGGVSFHDRSGKWIIEKDMIEKCGDVTYDVRFKVCDRCGTHQYVHPKDEAWRCCGGVEPYSPTKSVCCQGSVSDLSVSSRDAREAKCCGVDGYFPDVQICCRDKVHHLPGRDTNANDSTVQCCGEKPYLTTMSVCCNDVLSPLTAQDKQNGDIGCCGEKTFIEGESFCMSCGKTKEVLPLSEMALWSCCKEKHVYKSDESKCCDYGVEKGQYCRCQFNNNTYFSGERFSDPSSSSSCRTCTCQDGNTVCDTVSYCPAILPHGCSFYPANGECCPIFECFDQLRDNNHKIFLRRKSHVSATAVIPEMSLLTISFWMKTEQNSRGTLLSYATENWSDELVIRTHPKFNLTLKGDHASEISTNLNNGNWQFVCIQWSSSNGQWKIFINDPSQAAHTFTLGQGRVIGKNGYLVIGRQQKPVRNLLESEAFVGEVAYFNIWNSKIDFIDKVKTDCLGLYEGSLIRWSVGTPANGSIDTHHSASIIKANDVCPVSESARGESPGEVEFLWEALGSELENLSGQTCAESSVYSIRSTEHSFQLKVCPSSTTGSLGNLHFFVAKGQSDSPLYWPFPYSLKLSVVVHQGNPNVEHTLNSGSTRTNSNVWSLVTGTCPGSGQGDGAQPPMALNPTSSIWQDFITKSAAMNNYVNGKLKIKVLLYTEKYGEWLYWNGHYYSYRDRDKQKAWFGAEANCVTNGESVHLASIHSQLENDFLKSRSSDKQWIGLANHNDIVRGFNWADGSSFGGASYKNWATNEPNGNDDKGECGIIKTDGKWIDETCEIWNSTGHVSGEAKPYTCKTPGKNLAYRAPPVLDRQLLQENEAGVFSVDVTSDSATTKVTFMTGLHYIVPNMKFTSTADKISNGAKLEYAGYVNMTTEQLGSLYDANLPGGDTSRVADLDGIVDKIVFPHYTAMDAVGNTAFSFEFWMRPRRMPSSSDKMALFSKSSSTTGSISLIVHSSGALEFQVAPKDKVTPLVFVSSVTNESCKVKSLLFQHIAVTGEVGSSLKIAVGGESCFSVDGSPAWDGVIRLPASSNGPLVFGEGADPQVSNALKKFNGQVAYFRLFSTERTTTQIQTSIETPSFDSGAPVGSWYLRQSNEVKLIHYVISSSSQVSNLKALEDFIPAASSFPVVAFERNGNIFLFRLTEDNDLVAKEYRLSTDKTTLQGVSQGHTTVNTGSKRAARGCYTVARDTSRDRWICITCNETRYNPHEVIFTWKVFKMNSVGGIIVAQGQGSEGSLRVGGIGSLDTRPSATVVGDHLLLTAGTTNNAETLFLDLSLDRRARLSVSSSQIVAESIGPNIIHSGVSFYSYLYKPEGIGDSTAVQQTFLRRVRPQGNGQASTYTIVDNLVNPSTLTAASNISESVPNNDWFWFLFRISTLSGGNVITSGQRIVIQTPDNNPQNTRKWSFVKCNGENLQADQQGHIWNFWIFKTKTCDPQSGGYTVVTGDIGPNDCILLWPKTLQWGPNCFCKKVIAFPTAQQIQGARQTFGSWFGPWRLMVPMTPTPVRFVPQPTTSSGVTLPSTVYEGNKYALLHFGTEGISVSSQSGVRAALLRFARTSMAPVVVSNSGSTPPAKLVFRGNGGPLPLVGAFREAKVDINDAFDVVYREGSLAQKRMTSGLFYSVSYTPPSDLTSPGKFKNLSRISGLETFEYPEPPEGFIWLVPPPFKVNGVCEAVSKLFNYDDDTIKRTAPSSITSLTEVVGKAVGPGSFSEGLFKPLLSVHVDIKLLYEIGNRTYETVMNRLRTSIPQPPGSDSSTPRNPDTRWQEVGDVEACLYLTDMEPWNTAVQKQKVEDKLHQLFNSEWMKGEITTITTQQGEEVMRNASLKYSSYGGIAVLIANRLRGPAFLEELLVQDLSTMKVVLQSYLPVLDAIRPDLGIAARKDVISTLLARTIINQPWDVLKASLDKDKQSMAIRMAFDTLVGKLVPDDLQIETKDTILSVMKVLFNPLTSTQLAIIERVLNIKKQSALAVSSVRAEDFKSRFLEVFKTENAETIATFDNLPHLKNQIDDLRAGGEATWDEFVGKFYEHRDLRNRQTVLLMKFQDEVLQKRLFQNEGPLRPAAKSAVENWLLENPRRFSRVSFTFNAIGTLAATGSLILELANPDSGLRQGSAPDIVAAAATVVGAIGSFKGVFDFAKVLKEKMYPKPSSTAEIEEIPLQDLNRAPNDLAAFDRYAAEGFRVDLSTTERVNTRVAKYFEKSAMIETKAFLALGVIADFTFLGLSIYNIVEDFKADQRDAWKIVDDFGFAISAGAGAVIGILALAGVETGPAGLFVFLFGLAFIAIDAVRARKEAERKLHEARCNAWTQWCNWGKALFVKFNFLTDPSSNPCATCLVDRRSLIRALCMSGHFSAAHRAALKGKLGPSKDVRSLVPSFGVTKEKNRKGKGKKHTNSKKIFDL